MKWFVSCSAAVLLLAGVPARGGDYEFKPVDTKRLVVQPSRTAANLAANTINLVGNTAASAVESNGYVKTLNNLFGIKRSEPKLQSGKSQLPSPNLYKSTRYQNFNTPVMPSTQYRR